MVSLTQAVSRLWYEPAWTHINKPHHGMNIIMERVTIGSNYKQQLTWNKAIGIPLIHLPLITTAGKMTGGQTGTGKPENDSR